MHPHFRIDPETLISTSTTVLQLHGELDVATVGILEEQLTTAIKEGSKTVILDLRELQFIDSTGLRAILLADRNAREQGYTFALVQGPRQVQSLLELTGVSEYLRVAATPEELLSVG